MLEVLVFNILFHIFKDAPSRNARLCFIMEMAYKPRNGWDSGAKFCTSQSTDTVADNNGNIV